MLRESESGLPFLIAGVVAALVLIAISFGGSPASNAVLRQRFAAHPPDPASPPPEQVRLPDLPPDLQTQISDLAAQLADGQSIPALTPTAAGARVEVTVRELSRSGERVSVRGSVRNIGGGTVTIAPGAFIFRDSTGTTYATEGSGTTALQPGDETSFDLAVPLPEGLGLSMVVSLPPDLPIEQQLIVATR